MIQAVGLPECVCEVTQVIEVLLDCRYQVLDVPRGIINLPIISSMAINIGLPNCLPDTVFLPELRHVHQLEQIFNQAAVVFVDEEYLRVAYQLLNVLAFLRQLVVLFLVLNHILGGFYELLKHLHLLLGTSN